MVYLGPSRGCETCKRRRKKCDETRPSCMRCVTAKRTCVGYEDGANLVFRQYEAQNGSSSPFKSMARKCSLPVRVPGPGTDGLPEDSRPIELSEEEVEEYALRAFFYDYCIVSMNHSISRGYLDGLESMLNQLGQQSDLAKACKAVAFASHGIKLRRPRLSQHAEIMYHNLLRSLARTIESPASANAAELPIIAMLLGLYEMIVANESHPGYHNAHARGVAAILQIENSPLDLFGAVQFVRSGHPLVLNGAIQTCGIFSGTYSCNSAQTLDNLLFMFGPIWRKADILLANPPTEPADLNLLKDEAVALNREFAKWQESQAEDFKPKTAGHVRQIPPAGSHPAVGYWPGRVDTYLDLYVAGVWNTLRTARVLLLSLIIRLSELLNDNQDYNYELRDTLQLVEDVVASIPYHLADDVLVFIRDVGKNAAAAMNPGRSVGGLLLMHAIYVASNLLIVPQQIRLYLKDCLEWIGMYMGIGQASLFAKAPGIYKQYFTDGCMIVWTGMLM